MHVPYRGANFVDVIGGRITMTFQNTGSILPTVREGKLRALAVTSLKRSAAIPELPTMVEAGVPDFEATSWFGLLAPAGTPAPIIAKLHKQAVEIVQHPHLRENFGRIGLDVVSDAPDAFAAIIRGFRQMGEGDQDAGIKAASSARFDERHVRRCAAERQSAADRPPSRSAGRRAEAGARVKQGAAGDRMCRYNPDPPHGTRPCALERLVHQPARRAGTDIFRRHAEETDSHSSETRKSSSSSPTSSVPAIRTDTSDAGRG